MMFTHLKAVRKVYSMKDLRLVHRAALAAVRELETNEVRVITTLQECDRLLVYRFLGYGSLVSYAIEALELSKHQAYDYTSVARKAVELPALHEALTRGEVSVAKARRVMSVITSDNCEWWLKLLKSSRKRDIERAVANARGHEGRRPHSETDTQSFAHSERSEVGEKVILAIFCLIKARFSGKLCLG
jgi:hypothetical protein